MDTNLMLGSLNGKQGRQAHEDESQAVVDAVKGCVQTALVGESQNFRSSVAAAHRKFSQQQRFAMFTTVAACAAGSLIMMASIWEAHRITNETANELQYIQKQITVTDAFADLRRANLQPTGKLITQQGRTFIELKPAK